MLDEANSFHPNIKLVRQVRTTVSFLDVFIENKNGILASSVYRKDSTEPYIVPFRSDHLRHVFNNIIKLVFQDIFSLIFCFFPFSLTAIHRDISIFDSRNFLPTNYH